MLAGLPAPLLDAVTFHAATVPPVAVPVGQFMVTVTTDPAEEMPAELRVASPAGELAYFLDHRSPHGLDMLLRLLGVVTRD